MIEKNMEKIEYSDQDDFIKIVTFKRRWDDILIGYRQNNRVVYASVSTNLTDNEAKQRGYEQVKKALDYEQTLDYPSIDGYDMEPIEVFKPANPEVNKIEIIGDRVVHFQEEQEYITKEYAVKLTDQYGEPIEGDVLWHGAENGVLTVDNNQQEIEIKASSGRVTSSILIRVLPYRKSEQEMPAGLSEQVEQLKIRLLNADERYLQLDKFTISLVELKQFKLDQLKYFCSAAIYEGFMSSINEYEFGFNELDQANFTQQTLLIVAAGGSYEEPISWKTKNAGVIELTVSEFNTIINDAATHKLAQQNKYWALEQEVLNAATPEEVDAIEW